VLTFVVELGGSIWLNWSTMLQEHRRQRHRPLRVVPGVGSAGFRCGQKQPATGAARTPRGDVRVRVSCDGQGGPERHGQSGDFRAGWWVSNINI